MHQLVPDFIIENLRQNRFQGSFQGAAIFVDISGFTTLTETLMSHGQQGAEVLANVMRIIFTPLVRAVFSYEGFVTNFAGDAFMAVFPTANDDVAAVSLNATAAAWQIQEHMALNTRRDTRFGSFEFSAKVGVAVGKTDWGIIKSSDDKQAAFYFKGVAVDGCAAAEKLANASDIIINNAAFEAVNLRVSTQPIHDHWRITKLTATLPDPSPINPSPPELDIDSLVLFNPRLLLEREISGEFRQVISLFVRLQGDPQHEELVEFMQHVFALKEQYGGLLNRIDFGDKGCHLLLFWGAPISYENDVTRALEFILDLRRESNMPLRAGITYRIAHAGCIGSTLAEEYTCYGRGVNLAARYMVAADWNEIWLDQETAKRAETAFYLRSLGYKTFKGIAEPQPVYRLDGWREQTLSPFGSDPIVGRRKELRQLRDTFQPLYEGQFGGIMTICGDAGIGKSRLVHAFLDEQIQQQSAVFICQTDEILRQSLNPFRYFLRRYFDQSTGQDEGANKSRFGQIMAALMWSTKDNDLKADLDRGRSFLGALLGLHWPDSLYEQLEPELRFENTLDALKTLIKAESLIRPVIILLEDAHWLDDNSIQFLARLTRNVAGYPFALLVTSRSEMPHEFFDPAAPQASIKLQALNENSVTSLITAELGHRPSNSLLKLINERTDGNPFYVQQMLLYLRENELLEKVDKLVDAPLPGDVYVPADVRTLLTARLDRLPWGVKDVVQKAAVLGREFEIPILARMVGHDAHLAAYLDSGNQEDIWFALDEARYIFRHALLRDAAYDMQLQSRLRDLHRSAAHAFKDEFKHEPTLAPPYAQLAYHFDRAEDVGQARGYYGEAGDLARDEYHNEEAVAYFSRALELTPKADHQTRYTLICGRETIEQWQGRRDAQREDLEQLAAILQEHPDDVKGAELALRQSSFSLVTGDYETAVALAQKSLEFAREADNIEAMARAYHRWGRTLWQQGRALEAEQPIQKGLKLIGSNEFPDIEAMCHYDLVAVYFEQANISLALKHLQLAQQTYQLLEDQQGLVNCENALGVINYAQADYSNAILHYEKAIELCRQIGWRYVEPRYLSNIGNNYFDLGNYDLAKSYHEESLKICREIDNREIEAISFDTLGLIAHYSGQLETAVSHYEHALEILTNIDNQSAKGYTLTHLGYSLAGLGRYKAADEVLSQALDIRQGLGAGPLVIDTLAGFAQLRVKEGNIKEAQEIVFKILSWINEHGTGGVELPILVYLISFQVMSAAANSDHSLSLQAHSILDAGYNLLQRQSQRIQELHLRRQFIENVPYNNDLQQEWLRATK